jgi:hypothetical protein
MPFGVLPPPPPKFYFNISYAKKDGAKKLGAKFDFEKKCWYAPDETVKAALIQNEYIPIKMDVGGPTAKTLEKQLKIVKAGYFRS